MEIILTRTAGFCPGVKRAVNLTLAAPEKYKKPVYTYGQLIHNPQVLEHLNKKGISELDDFSSRKQGIVIIRAHGVPPDVLKNLKKAGFTVLDATCPRVIKVQAIIDKYTDKGYAIIIAGDKKHPEVVGLLGHAGSRGYAINDLQSLEGLPCFDKAIIVAQTTQNTKFYQKVNNWAAVNHPGYLFFNTICNSTHTRQAEVLELSKKVDAIIVIGGHNSGNTKRLAEIANQSVKAVFHVETESEINPVDLKHFKSIGITAGASTPDWVISKVCQYVKALN